MSLPNDFPEWAINDPSKVEPPLQAFANEGFSFKNLVSYKHFNFFINRLSQLYNGVIGGIFNNNGINPVSANLEVEVIIIKNKLAELQNEINIIKNQ